MRESIYILTITTHYGNLIAGTWLIQRISDLPRMFAESNALIETSLRQYLEIGDFTVPFGYKLEGEIR